MVNILPRPVPDNLLAGNDNLCCYAHFLVVAHSLYIDLRQSVARVLSNAC